jgi:transcriptional regulator of acetoin/glycerol metabolism
VLERKRGNVKEAAAALGIDRPTLYDKLKRSEIAH